MNRKHRIFAAVAVVALMTGGTASAQSRDWWNQHRWGGPNWGGGRPGGSVYAPGERDRILVERTCNGRFVAVLDQRIDRERRQGTLRHATADRMRYEVRRLDDRGRWACRNRDWRAARDTGDAFMDISHWIDRETRRGWNQHW